MTLYRQCQAYEPHRDYTGFGFCHLAPPTVLARPEGRMCYASIEYKFPIVDSEDWCIQAVPKTDLQVTVTDSQTNKE